MHEELWRDVLGQEGAYEVSSLGRVRSLDRYVRFVDKIGMEQLRLHRGKVLKPALMNRCSGLNHVGVSVGTHKGRGRRKRIPIHRLVAAAFIGPAPAKHDVCHWNGDETDNRWENLIYETRSVNHTHKLGHGVLKVSEQDVINLRQCKTFSEAYSYGKKIGISRTYANGIRTGKYVTHFQP